MKTAFVAPNLRVGGFERQWSLLVPGLARKGVGTDVFTLDDKGRFFDELAEQGIPVRCLELHGSWNLLGAVRAARVVAAREPDVIVSVGVSAHVVGQLASRRARTPHVAAIHSIPAHPESFTARRRMIVRMFASDVAATTAVTPSQIDFIRELGFDERRTHVIPNGVASTNPRKTREETRNGLGVGADEFAAVLIASLRPEKRVERFVQAITAARRTEPRIRGLIAGDGPEREAIRALCTGSDGAVTMLGPRPDTADVIEAADVVCLTSDAEALPLVLLEAMAGGRPVIATDVGGVRDAVVDDETGRLVPPEDVEGFSAALVELAAGPELATRFGEAGRRRQKELFTVDRMVDAHYELFQRLAQPLATANGSGEAP
jgi:glycosyltransferase involved in cell wall biosynthesis